MTQKDWREESEEVRRVRALTGPTLITDGTCNLCCWASDFIWHRMEDQNNICYMWPQHADTLKFTGISKESLMESWAVIKDGQIYRGSHAWIEIAPFLRPPWGALFKGMRFFPECLREAVYGLIAQNRYSWFGGSDACQRPDPLRNLAFLHPTDDIKKLR